MKEFFRSPSSLLLALALLTVAVISFRQLSDPDIGTHLRAGKWIVEHKAVPDRDTFTYTCNDHEYLDSHWLFQVVAYTVYRAGGYRGLTLFVFLMGMTLAGLMLARMRLVQVSASIGAWALFLGFLCIEPRITLRPEMFTFLFMTLMLLVLDRYLETGKRQLHFLPLIMLIWSNTHGLFILGFVLTGAYLASQLIRDRKADRYFLGWTGLSWIMTLATPYTWRLLAFPFLLRTRLETDNVFHQHIREFISFHHLDEYVFRDYLFIFLFVMTLLFIGLSLRRRRFHEAALPLIFLYLAWTGVRNIALFAVVAAPVFAVAGRDAKEIFKKVKWLPEIPWLRRQTWIPLIVSGLFFLGVGLRILTGAYYPENNSYNKPGWGLDDRHLPEKSAAFLLENGLDGRIINSLSLGGWLSWRLPQPVFIDGRLEVIGEEFYEEVRASWDGGLGQLITKYEPVLIVYNYDKYYPWSAQLSELNDWRLIRLDGFTAVFAKQEYAPQVATLDPEGFVKSLGIEFPGEAKRHEILSLRPLSAPLAWMKGFMLVPDYGRTDLLNMASFFLQMRKPHEAAILFLELLRVSGGEAGEACYPLADYFRSTGDREGAALCYRRILELEPGNEIARRELQGLSDPARVAPHTLADSRRNEAVAAFNEANRLFNAGDLAGARAGYERAISIDSLYYKAYNNLGILKASGPRDYRGAIDDFSRAIRIDPSIPDGWLGRGTCYFSLQQMKQACSDWSKAASLGNAKAAAMLRLHCK